MSKWQWGLGCRTAIRVYACASMQGNSSSPPVSASTPKIAAAMAGPIDAALSTAVFAALADPTRARLLACMAKCARGCSVGEVAECCDVDLSVVSRHLSLMAKAGVLRSSKVGRSVIYHVRTAEVVALLRNLAAALESCAGDGCNAACCVGKAADGKECCDGNC